MRPLTQALKLLARREHSARELKRKLAARGISDDEAASAVEHAITENWQSDARYAQMLVRTRVAGGYGPARIEAELEVAGVASDEIRAALDAAGVDWHEQAVAVHAKKFGRAPGTPAERARQYRFLQGRGFDSSQISAALKGSED
ncbi:MAG: regulatory protein RecX [Gammaproteobacteria bacterium]